MEKARVPLLVRVFGLAAVLVAGGVLVMWGVDLGQRVVGVSKGESGPSVAKQLAAAELELARVSAERDELAAKLKAVPAAVAAPPASSAELARLQADLALLEEALAPAKAGSGLLIRGMQARMAAPKLLHYTVLLQYGAKKKGPSAFAGRLKLAVAVIQDGKKAVLEYPKDSAERYDLKVDRYQRIDGTLEVPEGAKVVAVKVSLSENGKVVADETRTVRSL
ncbi:hypothetical protein SAMN05518865_12017 [Duganella sp. CF458]|uniref:DUF6776 family protein n=1 Tax=Duganella sp. CF458 TaxID=1884368 RepID=UPI0008E15641|nr:DUF6776 family protein [Duganella sp. CF458]SFG84121.1 hypothetical protein SAMN05518865_12017 [Duganella sp. CF458]